MNEFVQVLVEKIFLLPTPKLRSIMFLPSLNQMYFQNSLKIAFKYGMDIPN